MAKQTLSDELRQYIASSGLSLRAVCRAAEVDPSQLHRFTHGTGRLTNETMDRVAAALGLRLVKVKGR